MKQVKQSDMVVDESATKKQKLKNLHKMLDKEIQTVNKLFQKDNGFQEIQLKLKQLEVKLNSIKQDNHIPDLHGRSVNANHNHEQKPNQDYPDYNFVYKQKQHQSLNNNHSPSQQLLYPPFQRFSQHKKKRKQNKINDELINKGQSQFRNSQVQKNKSRQNITKGKKLNFDEPHQHLSTSYQKKRKLQNFDSDDRKKLNKIKSQNNLYKGDRRKRNISHNSKTNSMQKSDLNKNTANSTKEIRFSSCKRKNDDLSWKSQKKNNHKKQRFYNQNQISLKLFKNEYDWRGSKKNTESNKRLKDNLRQIKFEASKRQQGRKQRVKNIISNTEKKRLEKELQTFKLQNEDLQKQISELKQYRHQYQKLRVIFVKQQKLKNQKRRS